MWSISGTRPLADLQLLLDAASLEHHATNVMEALEPLEREVGSLDDATRVRMKILPYRDPRRNLSAG
jgi:hypothetical protein